MPVFTHLSLMTLKGWWDPKVYFQPNNKGFWMSWNITFFRISTINKNNYYDILIEFWIAHVGSSDLWLKSWHHSNKPRWDEQWAVMLRVLLSV